jgi:hypothetical protein
LVLAVATSAHASVAIPRDEGTLSRGLRTPLLPGTHASVGDCWQNSKCCHLLIRRATQFPRHPRVAPDPLQAGLRLLPRPLPAIPSATPYGGLTPKGGRRAYHVPRMDHRWFRPRLSAGGASATAGERRAPAPGHLPFWFQPISAFGWSVVTTVLSGSPELALPSTLAPDRRDASSRRALSRGPRPPDRVR